ncbi:hypothetical protein [Streptomyces sp. NPDC095613]|uniref:hypothetical protein n=1 Tax=Streptomyces sp. NPDC095613 TaxID=3155540 RepID=UPI003317E7FE
MAVGALTLALSVGLVPAQAAPAPAPQASPTPAPTAPAPAIRDGEDKTYRGAGTDAYDAHGRPSGTAGTDGRAASDAGFRPAAGTAGIADGVIETSEETSVTDETPPTVSVTTSGNQAQVLFEADAGDDLSFGFTESTFPSQVTVRLLDPQGSRLASTAYSGPAGDWETADVPVGGRYALIIDPGTGNTGSVKVTVSEPTVAALDLAGPTAEARFTRTGQDHVFTFPGAPGDSLSLGIDAAELPEGAFARLYDPSGTRVDTVRVTGGRTNGLDVDSLARSGTYTLELDPDNAVLGTVKVTGSHYADAGTLTAAGPAAELALGRPGQDGLARFEARAGQRVSLGARASGLGTSTAIDVRTPNGALLDSFSAPLSEPAQWDSAVLPDTGTYTVVVSPGGAVATGTLSLTLSEPVALAPLTTSAAPAAVTVTRAGQNAETGFQAQAGTNLSLGFTGNTFTEFIDVTVTAPSGAKVVDGTNVSSGASATIPLAALPETGTYTVVLDAYRGAVGTLNLTLSADIQPTVTVDGAEQAVTPVRAGQRVRARFTAPDSATLGLAVTANTVAESTEIRLIGPDGKDSDTGTLVGRASAKSAEAYYLTGLTAGARYTLVLEPSKAATGALTLWLSKPVNAGTLSASTPSVTGKITRPGQQLEFTVNATAGSGAAVVFDGTTFAKSSDVIHQAPGGTEEDLGSLSKSAFDADLRAPLAAGAHRLLVRPKEPVTGTTKATLLPDVNGGTLSTSGIRKSVTIATAGQNAHYTFTGTKGQKLTLGLEKPPAAWQLSVSGPDGKWLVDGRTMSATAVSYALAALPADGTYTLTVAPNSLKTGTYSLGLTAAAPAG